MKLRVLVLILAVTVTAWGQANEVDLLIKKKKEIEAKIKSNKNDLIVFAQIKGEKKMQVVKNENWPENIETTFNILKSASGQIIYLGEFPSSESGDWTLELKHFFNDKGETFAFEKRLTFFNEDCGNGVVVEKLTNFFTKDFKLIGTLRQLRDGNDNAITDHKSCSDPYQWTIDKKGSVSELMKLKKIEL
jgi:hypothetical protein